MPDATLSRLSSGRISQNGIMRSPISRSCGSYAATQTGVAQKARSMKNPLGQHPGKIGAEKFAQWGRHHISWME